MQGHNLNFFQFQSISESAGSPLHCLSTDDKKAIIGLFMIKSCTWRSGEILLVPSQQWRSDTWRAWENQREELPSCTSLRNSPPPECVTFRLVFSNICQSHGRLRRLSVINLSLIGLGSTWVLRCRGSHCPTKSPLPSMQPCRLTALNFLLIQFAVYGQCEGGSVFRYTVSSLIRV